MLVCSGLTVLAYMAPEPKIMLNALGQDKKKKKGGQDLHWSYLSSADLNLESKLHSHDNVTGSISSPSYHQKQFYPVVSPFSESLKANHT